MSDRLACDDRSIDRPIELPPGAPFDQPLLAAAPEVSGVAELSAARDGRGVGGQDAAESAALPSKAARDSAPRSSRRPRRLDPVIAALRQAIERDVDAFIEERWGAAVAIAAATHIPAARPLGRSSAGQ